ncbi:MAG TPA: hypothetical protein VHK24_13035, partial [Steroidobacter sp.]|nr:hypothetical protein [Steroidobacter sp.]
MRMTMLVLLLGAVAQHVCAADAGRETTGAPDSRAVLTGAQVVQILDETVDWYRTLGVQQQIATQPSDLLILYANRQTADKLMALAFEIARANAELLSSEAGAAQAGARSASASETPAGRNLDDRRAAIQAQIDSRRRELAVAPAGRRVELQAKIAVLQGEFDLVNARRNLLNNMAQYEGQNDTNGFGANALKAHIDAIAASVPSSGAGSPTSAPAAAPANPSAGANAEAGASLRQLGIWDLAGAVFRLSAKSHMIVTIDQRTAA